MRGMTKRIGLYLTFGIAAGCGGSADAPASVGPDVWAVVDGREIRRDDVERAYRGSIDPSAAAPSEEEALTVKLNVLDELITQDILLARARALGIVASDTDVDNAVAERKRAVSDADFQKQLDERKLTLEDLKAGLRRELSIQKLMEHDVTSKITISDQAIADFYSQNRERFNLAEPQYRLAQIVVTPGRDPLLRNRMNNDAGSADEAKRKVDMLSERLRTGTQFSELALDYSEDPQTAVQGGDLGFVPESALSRVSAPLREAVLKMQPGNVTTVTAGGSYTILMLVSKEPAGQRELASPDVRDGIRDMLRATRQELLQAAYVSAARADADVTNHLAHRVVEAQGAPKMQ